MESIKYGLHFRWNFAAIYKNIWSKVLNLKAQNYCALNFVKPARDFSNDIMYEAIFHDMNSFKTIISA